MSTHLLEAINIQRQFSAGRKIFGKKKPTIYAVRTINLNVTAGETLGIVGESGCGKSTLARMLVGLDKPSSGEIKFNAKTMQFNNSNERKELAKQVQYVFQDSTYSLNPRKTIRQALEAPMINLHNLSKDEREENLMQLMNAVNLHTEFLDRYPHEFSGGQAQRICIARALAARPKLLVLDEPVSALDVSVQAKILNLLAKIKSKFNLTYIFISHDLSVVESISDRVMVMYFGSVVELAVAKDLFSDPKHPYTRLLIASVPLINQKSNYQESKLAELPDPFNPPTGCAFASRCNLANEFCTQEQPKLEDINSPTHKVSCFMVKRN